MAESKAQRTEQPTGKRLSDARKEGNVPRSKELSSAMVLGVFLLFCHLFGSDWMQQLESVLIYCFSNLFVEDLTAAQWLYVVRSIGSTTAQLLFLPVGMVALAGVGGQILQGAPPLTLHPFKPNLSKMNPIKGVKKIFSAKSLVTLAKALVNLVLFTTIAAFAVRDAISQGLPGAPGVEGTVAALFTIADKVILRVMLLWLLISILDLLFTRYDYIRNLRMTRQEIKDERKHMEGDPRVKGKIRSKQLEMARARMMADVPNATVVITNPTHYAVALRYVPGDTDVPVLLAKGRGPIARRIREIATEHRIPIIQDPPLARSIYSTVPLGSSIPMALYRAVAEVMALVIRGGQRRRAAMQSENQRTFE